jgi:hypothetical protein
MTVEEVRHMPNQEFLEWGVYHGRRNQQAELEQKMARRGRGR